MERRVSASVARERFADLLDAAEAGHPVFIERRGVRYTLTKVTARKARTQQGLVVAADTAIVDGHWTWDWGKDGLAFVGQQKKP